MTEHTPNFFDEYELVPEPIPDHETPHQLILRMTGNDYPELEPITWSEAREMPGMMDMLVRLCHSSELVAVFCHD